MSALQAAQARFDALVNSSGSADPDAQVARYTAIQAAYAALAEARQQARRARADGDRIVGEARTAYRACGACGKRGAYQYGYGEVRAIRCRYCKADREKSSRVQRSPNSRFGRYSGCRYSHSQPSAA